ncbi:MULTISPECIES: YlcI/YnfO family protein [unclassified Burkholderia]|uniref:YlcI/YnfO family protein n=1 Tax=unclassified Burkholderia TaxID=2613784 RepID=UPI000F583057|nr:MULTISPECIES: YlcI/YnfO family protein [unclassified Burkholderia]RQR44208.1 prevent-host-death protein [Burkholderia sp. Bp9131]RQR71031.1 prevent-host-death protein [Burkholderia sp. Bp9015]RQR80469.1 prevent-host-death protein [Burkholderia sp. Bp9011]RQR89997.1 prevent-host-death protein [Burkholderia sp. Bp9010]RQR97793.1 prevent-host-death protein [Burkholderia sp. Bp8994]
MKTTAMSVLRVDRKLLEAAESVLEENETLSAFVESTLRAAVARRRTQREFVARGLASADEARRTGEYVDAAEVQASLGTMLNAARAATTTG